MRTSHASRLRVRSVAAATLGALALIGSLIVAAPAQALSDTGTGGTFMPTTGRILDTKNNIGGYSTPMPADTWRTVKVAGLAGVPDDGTVGAVSLVATVASIPSQAVLYGRPDSNAATTSMGIYGGIDNDNTSFSSVLSVAADGTIQVKSQNSVRLILDVQGYYTANADGTAPGGFVPVNGKRIVDTRSGLGAAKGGVVAGKTTTVQVSGVGGVPAGASGAIVNLIALNTTDQVGYLTPYPSDGTRPVNSFNYAGSTSTSMQMQVQLSADGKINIYNYGSTVNLIVDVQGYFTAAGQSGAVFTPGTGRVYDSRATGNTIVGAQETRAIQIAGQSGVPAMSSGINAVVLSFTVAHGGGQNGGYARVWANGATEPDTSSINYDFDSIRTNTITVPLGANGKINLHNVGEATNYVFDVQGWYVNPVAPKVSCPSPYAAGSWNIATPSSLTCTIVAPAATSTGQYLEISSPAGIQDKVLSEVTATSQKVSFTPSGGVNEVYATIADADGDPVAENSLSLGFGDWSKSTLTSVPADGATSGLPLALSVATDDNSVFFDDEVAQYVVSANKDMSAPLWTSSKTADATAVPDGLLESGRTYYWTAAVSGSTDWFGKSAAITTTPRAVTISTVIQPLTSSQEMDIRSRMAALGIDDATQTALVAKVNSGQLPDSSVPGATPVTTISDDSDGASDTVYVYADGSRSSRTIESAPAAVPAGAQVRKTQPSKSGCKKSAGWYINCKIEIRDWVSYASFVVDYQASSSGKAKVRDMRAKQCGNGVGSCSVSGKIKRGTQSSAGPAWAELSFHADVIKIGSGVSGAFGIRVSGKNASTYF